MENVNFEISEGNAQSFFEGVADVLSQAQEKAHTAVNAAMVYAYYEIGRRIIEQEQHGKNRATYGKQIIKGLSEHLTERFGKGFSVGNLKNIRQFYRVYSQEPIGETVFSQFGGLPAAPGAQRFVLSWSHYLFLMRIDDPAERRFYEIESAQNHWSLREMKRQFGSSLYERLALSSDKSKVAELAKKGQIIERPSDLVKDPYVLEFLGLPELSAYSESTLERRIIDHLQDYLMEMGKGFTFVGRQVRFTFDEEHFRIDLVLYNRLLRCFVLVDLKIGKLKHQDLGQMQMYVNYYDRYEKTEEENPTIGILLCNEKSDQMVELTLPKDSNIYASKYQLYLPDKKLLREKLIQWREEEEDTNE